MTQARIVHLLYVDDDEICQMMLARTFKETKFPHPILYAQDGTCALEMLRGTNGRERVSRPFLILTDLNMAPMGGIELLKELRQDEELKKSIVFLFSSSNADDIKVQTYNLGIAGYILKTDPANSLLGAAALLDNYCRVVEFPAA